MQYQTRIFINEEAKGEGYVVRDSGSVIELSRDQSSIKASLSENNLEIISEGEFVAIIQREGKTAKLPTKSQGKVMAGDIVWLLSLGGAEDFYNNKGKEIERAGVRLEIIQDRIEPKKEIYINSKAKSMERRNPTFNIILGGVVLLLLIAGTVLGYQKRKENENKRNYEELKVSFEKSKSEIESVRTMDIETALKLAKEAEEKLSNSFGAEIMFGKEINSMREEMAKIKQSLGGEGVNYEEAYDTSLIKEGAGFEKMGIKDEVVYLWSPSLGRIDMVNIPLKSTENITTNDKVKEWMGIFYGGDNKWYGYQKNKLIEITRKEMNEKEIENIAQAAELSGWNGLIYLIDNEDRSIKKVSNNKGNNWLKNEKNLAEDGVSLTIDGGIWILGKSGQIYHYNRGEEEKFEMSSIPLSVNPKSLRTNDKIDFLAYVTEDKYVVICGKDGKILAKYSFGDIKINDIAIGQNNSVLVLAGDEKIYRIKVK